MVGWGGVYHPPRQRPKPHRTRTTHPHPGLPLEGEGEGRMNTIALPATRDHKDARNDRLFRSVLVATVVFVLLALAGAALSMLLGGRPSPRASGLAFSLPPAWTPART